jgi:purine catabolism regulator
MRYFINKYQVPVILREDKMVNPQTQLTVGDIIQRPLFQDAVVVANDRALKRVVRWAHVLEVTEIDQLLNGHELILSTGIGWQDNEETSASFVQQLIDNNASGLCVELGSDNKKPLERMKHLALEADFPLIFFPHKVRYIDLIRDLHTYFINQQQQMNADLELFSRQLDELSLSGRGLTHLLKLCHKTTQAQIIYTLRDSSDSIFFPPVHQRDKSRWITEKLQAIREQLPSTPSDSLFKLCPINIMDQQFAELALYAPEGAGPFEQSALERCATAVAHELMRTMYNEERQKYTENQWLRDWLDGAYNEQEISARLSAVVPFQHQGSNVVCILEPDPSILHAPEFDSMLIHRNIAARQLFEQEGFALLTTLNNCQVIYIAFNRKKGNDVLSAVMRILKRLQAMDAGHNPPLFSQLIGIGSLFHSLDRMHRSYTAAKETIAIQKYGAAIQTPFSQDLHIYRIIHNLHENEGFQDFCMEYLAPILDYDIKNNGQLFVTLRTLLQQSGSKQDASKSLFVVRQTLYHRIDKLKELLGEDFMMPHKRIAIELAVYAHEYSQNKL